MGFGDEASNILDFLHNISELCKIYDILQPLNSEKKTFLHDTIAKCFSMPQYANEQ